LGVLANFSELHYYRQPLFLQVKTFCCLSACESKRQVLNERALPGAGTAEYDKPIVRAQSGGEGQGLLSFLAGLSVAHFGTRLLKRRNRAPLRAFQFQVYVHVVQRGPHACLCPDAA